MQPGLRKFMLMTYAEDISVNIPVGKPYKPAVDLALFTMDQVHRVQSASTNLSSANII